MPKKKVKFLLRYIVLYYTTYILRIFFQEIMNIFYVSFEITIGIIIHCKSAVTITESW